MEDVLAIVLIFGGGAFVALSYSPIGKAIAARIRGEQALPPSGPTDPAVYDEMDRLRQEMTELQERVDFTERMLAQRNEAPRVGGGSDGN
ncbi:MAG: hypothetical protein ABI647_19430 [Gemmatimonadota bacterium]